MLTVVVSVLVRSVLVFVYIFPLPLWCRWSKGVFVAIVVEDAPRRSRGEAKTNDDLEGMNKSAAILTNSCGRVSVFVCLCVRVRQAAQRQSVGVSVCLSVG